MEYIINLKILVYNCVGLDTQTNVRLDNAYFPDANEILSHPPHILVSVIGPNELRFQVICFVII